MSNILKGLNEGYFNRDEQDQQNAMDTRRRSDLSGERNAGLNEPDELPTTPQQSRNGVYEYNVPTGQEKIAQELGLQLHKGHWFSRVPVQRANFQFGRPQFHEIPSKNISEAEQDYGPEYQDKVQRLGQMAKQGERKTVWDPVKRVYKTVPVNPPKEQGVAEAEAPLKHHTARVSYRKEGDPHRRYEAIFKTTHNGGKEETEKRAKAAFAAKKKIVYDIVHEQGVAEGFPKDPNAPKLVQDRKTGKWYDPNKEFEKKMNSPEVMAQMKRMAQKEGVAEGVAETLPMDDAVKVLRQYGADHFKTTSNELHFYKQGRPFSVDLVMNPDATRSVTLRSLNSATRGLKGQGVAEEQEESCPHCGGAMFSEMIMNEKKDACYYKVKSRYKVWPSAYASGALVKCRKSGADSWGDGGKKNESSILEGIEQVDENLNKWFKEKWVRFGPDGKIRGDCARGDDSEGKPKCLPQSKAQNLGKKGRASAASRKRREDPNPERSGKAINVNTKKK